MNSKIIGKVRFNEDAQKTHSAGSFLGSRKLSIVIDFLSDVPIKKLFKDLSFYQTDLQPLLTKRKPLDEAEFNSILSLKEIINEINFVDIAGILAKIHFFTEVSNEAFFDWLETITIASGNPNLVEKTYKMRAMLIEKKEVFEYAKS